MASVFKQDIENTCKIINDIFNDYDLETVTYRKDLALGLRRKIGRPLTHDEIIYINELYDRHNLKIVGSNKNAVFVIRQLERANL